jgi:hypothetical protein
VSDQSNMSHTIQVGDTVAYRAENGEILGTARGKVLGVFRTRDGKTFADVEWDQLMMPKRVRVERLTATVQPDR